LPAPAIWSIHVDGNVSELTRGVVAAAVKTAIDDDSARQTGTHADVKQIANVRVLRFAMPDLSER
jgi:hypothetical protein